MEFITENLIPLLVFGIGALFAAIFISVLVYQFYRINSTDYSDQTGWKNFSEPMLALSLIVIAVQAIIIALLAFYYYSNN